jgi:Zn-dependent protease with chaperone function
MYSRLVTYGSALLIGAALTCVAPAQDNAAEKAGEQQADRIAADNSAKEPHMGAALKALRTAEEELEKANTQHGGTVRRR